MDSDPAFSRRSGTLAGRRPAPATTRAESREMARLLRRYGRSRQAFRRRELLARLDREPIPIVSTRVRRLPVDRARLVLDDGSAVSLRLIWPGAGTPCSLTHLCWRDEIGWLATVVDARGEALTWYSWAVRVV